MADDPAPPRTVPATSKDFRHIAKSTGEEVKDALQKGLEPATRTTFYAFFDNASFDIETSEGKSNILNKVKDHFKKEVNSTCARPQSDVQLMDLHLGIPIPASRRYFEVAPSLCH